jgi:hypothetical protein
MVAWVASPFNVDGKREDVVSQHRTADEIKTKEESMNHELLMA